MVQDLIIEWLDSSPGKTCVMRNDICDRDAVDTLRISKESFMGQIVGYYKKIVICGYIHILCGKGEDSIIDTNAVDSRGFPQLFPGALIIAYDGGGGLFAVNGGACAGGAIGNVLYLPNGSFCWEDLRLRYASFLKWALSITEDDLVKGAWKQKDQLPVKGDLQEYIIGKAAAYNMFIRQQKGISYGR